MTSAPFVIAFSSSPAANRADGLAGRLIALQAPPKTGDAPVVGAGDGAGPTVGAVSATRAGASVHAGAPASAPDDSFAARASQQIDLLPPAQAGMNGGVDAPGALLLALAAVAFALRHLADNRR